MSLSRHALLLVLLVGASSARADQFKIDPAHSFVNFRAGHLGLGYVDGRFNNLAGSFAVSDDKARVLTAFEATVESKSVDTKVGQRDDDLRSANYLEVVSFPEIRFRAGTIKADGTGYVLGGDLTLHGVTRPITLKLQKRAEGRDPWGGYRLGLTGSYVLKRSDFGMTKMLKMVDDEVSLTVAFEGIRE
jgi:polyisoprenoid-binding protein YceI